MDRVFELVSPIERVETIARGHDVRCREWLQAEFGKGRWRKMKGVATIRYPTGQTVRAELHWYEAHGKGRVDMKVKREL